MKSSLASYALNMSTGMKNGLLHTYGFNLQNWGAFHKIPLFTGMINKETTAQEIITRRGYRQNIKGDPFSLYISNYPVNAQYLKSRIGNSELILAELCCSIGITLEYLAPGFKKIIGIDIDKDILEICKTNLTEAGCMAKAELIHGDDSDDKVLKNISADIVIYDIPYWYTHKQENQGNLIDKNPPFDTLIEKIKRYITPNIIVFSPPEWSYEYFETHLGEIEFEQVFIDGVHNRNQVYTGELIQEKGKTKIELTSK